MKQSKPTKAIRIGYIPRHIGRYSAFEAYNIGFRDGLKRKQEQTAEQERQRILKIIKTFDKEFDAYHSFEKGIFWRWSQDEVADETQHQVIRKLIEQITKPEKEMKKC